MIRYSDPFAALLALQSALDARRDSGWFGRSTAGVGGYPPINIFQRGDDFVAIIELPGLDRGELNLQAQQNTIRISGRKVPAYGETASVHRREREFGMFDRTISLPVEIDADAIQAEYRDGILALSIPRAPSQKPRSIKIS
jgi:HSP20 family protein